MADLPTSDLGTAAPGAFSVDALVDVFPELALPIAQEIVAWQRRTGEFPDTLALVVRLGVDPGLAVRIAQAGADGTLATASAASAGRPPALAVAREGAASTARPPERNRAAQDVTRHPVGDGDDGAGAATELADVADIQELKDSTAPSDGPGAPHEPVIAAAHPPAAHPFEARLAESEGACEEPAVAAGEPRIRSDGAERGDVSMDVRERSRAAASDGAERGEVSSDARERSRAAASDARAPSAPEGDEARPEAETAAHRGVAASSGEGGPATLDADALSASGGALSASGGEPGAADVPRGHVPDDDAVHGASPEAPSPIVELASSDLGGGAPGGHGGGTPVEEGLAASHHPVVASDDEAYAGDSARSDHEELDSEWNLDDLPTTGEYAEYSAGGYRRISASEVNIASAVSSPAFPAAQAVEEFESVAEASYDSALPTQAQTPVAKSAEAPAEVHAAPDASAHAAPAHTPAPPQALAPAHTPAPAHEPATAHTPAPAPAPAGRSRLRGALIAAVVAVNSALIAGGVGLYLEQQRVRVPIATISADVVVLKSGQAEARTKLDATVVKLDETRERLDETRAKLADQARAIADGEQRQKDAERESRERDAKEARAISALASRVYRVEQTTYRLDDAIKLIDLVQGRPTSGELETAP
jgi:hypothetical protein